MTTPSEHRRPEGRLRRGIVLRVQEDSCEIVGAGERSLVRFATSFPSPRIQRVSPGHLVAVARGADGPEAVVWRWYDAVVLGDEGGLVRMAEPAHGEVLARPARIPAPRARKQGIPLRRPARRAVVGRRTRRRQGGGCRRRARPRCTVLH